MSNHTSARSIIVLFVITLSLLLVGCGGGGGGGNDNKSIQGQSANEIDRTVIIEAKPVEGSAPLEVRFTPVSDDLILRASWDFGDGVTAVPVVPTSSVTHTYIEDGTYTVTLSADLNLGGTQTDTIDITVGSGQTGPVLSKNVNLIVSSFAIDTEVTPGSLETVSAIIRNIGTGTLEVLDSDLGGLIHVGYYLSTDDNITVDDVYIGDTSILLGTFFAAGEIAFGFESLSPGENFQYNHQLAVKNNIPAGIYYAGAIVDYIDYYEWYTFPRATNTEEYLFPVHIVVPETNENDNARLLTAHQVTVLNTACVEDGFEEDDNSAIATPISLGESQAHNFCTDNSDWLKFDAVQGGVYKISTSGLGTETDTQLILYDRDATTILLFDDNLGNASSEFPKDTVDLQVGFPVIPESEIVWEAEVTGTYFIKVRTTACDEDQDTFCDGPPDGPPLGSPDGVGLDTEYTITLQ